MRLREWRVYRIPSSLFSVTNEDISKLKFVAQYNLERSPPKDGTPACVQQNKYRGWWARFSIVNYETEPGTKVDGYQQIKLLKGLSVLARKIRKSVTGINAVIVYGHNQQLQDSHSVEVGDDIVSYRKV